MRWLLFAPLMLILSGCTSTTTQSHILSQAKAEIAKRESWGDQAFIRVENRPNRKYMSWKDMTWKVSAGAFDYSGYPNYQGVRVIAGTERELKFSRDGCLVGYKKAARTCSNGTRNPAPVIVDAPPAK
jgi:hypothetical protein